MFYRLKDQWQCGLFSLNDADGKIIDIEKTFQPKPKILLSIVKLGLLGWMIQALVNSLATISYSPPVFWMAFLTNWQGLLNLAYLFCSMLLMVIPRLSQQVDGEPNRKTQMIFVKITWFLYTASINLSLLASLLYWFLEYDPEKALSYKDLMMHGVIFIFVFVDGMIINRIPIRLKQILWVEVVPIMYLLWTIIHLYSGIGNPLSGGEALYEAVDFKATPVFASILVVVLTIIVVPALFIVLYLISSLFKKRYLASFPDDNSGERIMDDEGV